MKGDSSSLLNAGAVDRRKGQREVKKPVGTDSRALGDIGFVPPFLLFSFPPDFSHCRLQLKYTD